MNGPALQISALTKRFDRVTALDDVTFDVPTGAIFGLLGPNGAGKTTLFSIIANFLHADQGSIRVLDTDVRHISQLRGRITILPQDALFQRNVPIIDQLVFLRRLDGQDSEDAEREVVETLELVGLGDYMKRGVHALSHGMIKRMGIAQAFLGRPEVIMLDEPTAGLDPQNARQIRDLIRDLQQTRNTTTVISSHNLLEIQELCDHVAILDQGRLVSAGSVDEITRAGRQLELTLSRDLADREREQLLRLVEVVAVDDRAPRRYRLTLDLSSGADADAALIKVLRQLMDAGIAPRAVAEGSSLEEFFLQVTGEHPESPGRA